MFTWQWHGGVFSVSIWLFVKYQGDVWTGQTQELNLQENTHARALDSRLHHAAVNGSNVRV